MLLSCFLFIAFSCSEADEAVNPSIDNAGKANMNGKDKGTSMMKEFWVEISPLNNSGVTGHAKLMVDGTMLTVELWAEGLAPNELHPQHIHGFKMNNANSTCPPPSADMDGDGLVELLEGLPFYGPILLPLTPFPMATDGTIHYKQTFTLGMDEMISYHNLKPLQNRVIVLHGAYVLTDMNGNAMIVPKGTEGAMYVVTLPVACGQIMPNNNGMKMGMK